MFEIMENIKAQILNGMVLNTETISKLNKFFNEWNIYNKGSNDSEIFVYVDNFGTLQTNLLNDTFERVLPFQFKKLLIEWLEMETETEILYDLFIFLCNAGLIELTNDLKLILFKKMYLSGYFGAVVDGIEFINDFDYYRIDLKLISICLNTENVFELNYNIETVQRDLYLMDNIGLKEILV